MNRLVFVRERYAVNRIAGAGRCHLLSGANVFHMGSPLGVRQIGSGIWTANTGVCAEGEGFLQEMIWDMACWRLRAQRLKALRLF
ncbi:MAG: hypothetical protein HFE84_10490 [Lachnospiraceae bacterium]|nr:hypothetical protein [Lachnospiraceae bacterium]